MRLVRGLVWGIVGGMPGLIIYLIAEFLVSGEWQLTIGAPGILIGVCGLILGFALGVAHKGPRRLDGRPT